MIAENHARCANYLSYSTHGLLLFAVGFTRFAIQYLLYLPKADKIQINLIVGEVLKLKHRYVQVMEEALEVIKWFNSHSLALGILQEEQLHRIRHTRSRVLSLILPVLTRWTSHYLAACRLLELEDHLRFIAQYRYPDLHRAAGNKSEAKRRADEVLQIVLRESFWADLKG